MSVRISAGMLISLVLLVPQADAKNKKKQALPDYVLNAERVLVVIRPDAGEPVTNPTANRTALEDVEKAIMKWGRFHLVMEPQFADLVIAVRKGLGHGSTVSNSPADDRPVIFQPTDGGVRIGVQQGRSPVSPDLTNPDLGRSQRQKPHTTNEVGPPEDTFEVYQGGVKYPLDSSPVWRYMAKDALNGPRVEAVEKFRKAIADAEEQRQHKP